MTGRDASRQEEEKHLMCVTWFKCSCQVKGVFVDGEGLKKLQKNLHFFTFGEKSSSKCSSIT